ncbi:9918_t:CDS:2 [Acaulospora morrowiae]|uniref:9918_t:CDS:1 n=1 Tax=Acaulospora morrowiae TaxID=94023 RepID=A0A9N9CML9_9GLOM|nr:9918_t:CDS:2 [Acaulospora morrowiae]
MLMRQKEEFPSQTTLDLIVNYPLGKSILTEALNQHPLDHHVSTQPVPTSFQHSFRTSNRIAKKEFIAVALKIYDWKEEGLMLVRKYNGVKHLNEEALKQVFIDTLILILHTDIESEFQVYSQKSNFGGKSIDLVRTNTYRENDSDRI